MSHTKLSKIRILSKSIISLVILGTFFLVPVFAQSPGTTDNIQFWGITMNTLVSFLSWARALFAILAGKLMTNSFVYASFMGLDSFLWQIRNIMKNFANFTIGFLFLFYIFKGIFSKDGNRGTFVKEKIVSFLVAGILIQMSWFLFAAVIDLSTVATSAIGAFPASVIESNGQIQ
ncbi:MAG: hypothetical protein GXP45_03285 [bacterium]|nr:hypothetical protein [bacterium]